MSVRLASHDFIASSVAAFRFQPCLGSQVRLQMMASPWVCFLYGKLLFSLYPEQA